MSSTKTQSKNSNVSTAIESTRLDAFINPLWENDDKRYTVLCGGAGSGKTHALVQYFSYLFLTVENCEFAVTMKDNPSLKRAIYMGSPSIIRQLAEWGLPMGDWHNKTDQVLRNPIKGNTMYFLSLDDPEKIKSMNLNYIWMEEATRFNIADFRQFNTRLRGPNKNSINKMFLSFNPVSLYNWVYQWFIVNPSEQTRDKSIIHISTPFDNPYLPSEQIDEMMDMGRRDPNYFRVYIMGEPGVPSGLVYKNLKFQDEGEWPSEVWEQRPFYGLDFGFNDPMALVEVREYDKTYYVRERYYRTEQHIEDLIRWMNDNSIDRSSYIFCDSASPERIHKLTLAGYTALKANKDVFAGINAINASDIIISQDSENLRNEAMTYQWKPKGNGEDVLKDEPLKENDHACFAKGTMVMTINGEVPIEDIRIGDMVLTREGYRPVTDCAMTGIRDTYTYHFSNGTCIRCTPDHPFYVSGKGFMGIDAIRYDDYLCGLNTRHSRGRDIIDIRTRIFGRTGCISNVDRDICTESYGLTTTDPYRRGWRYIISTGIAETIESRTCDAYPFPNISLTTPVSTMRTTRNGYWNTSNPYVHSPRRGILQRKGVNHTDGSPSKHIRKGNRLKRPVLSVVLPMKHLTGKAPHGSVRTNANRPTEGKKARSMLNGCASSVARLLKSADTVIPNHAHVHVRRRCDGRYEKVYNLTVQDEHEYYANGILVSNCDALRYALHSTQMIGKSSMVARLGKESKETTKQGFIPKNL